MEHLTLKAASAYQAASKRRVPPPMFGPLRGEPGSAPTAASEIGRRDQQKRAAVPGGTAALRA